MKVIKGCVNDICKYYHKNEYKIDDHYCKNCGQKLVYVCRDCWMELPDDLRGLCITCEAKRKDKRDKRIEAVKKAGKGVAGVVGAVAAVGANAEKVADGVGKVAEAGKKIVRVVKK